MKSRSDEQLRSPSGENETSNCKPEDIVNGKAIVPCGLIAWSLFNDTYIFSRNNEQLPVNKNGISWKSDRNHKFGKKVFPKNFQNGTLRGGKILNESIPVSLTTAHLNRLMQYITFLRLYLSNEKALICSVYKQQSFVGLSDLIFST